MNEEIAERIRSLKSDAARLAGTSSHASCCLAIAAAYREAAASADFVSRWTMVDLASAWELRARG